MTEPREALAALLMREGIAVENVASMGNAEQWLPDYALADRLIAAGVHLGDEGRSEGPGLDAHGPHCADGWCDGALLRTAAQENPA